MIDAIQSVFKRGSRSIQNLLSAPFTMAYHRLQKERTANHNMSCIANRPCCRSPIDEDYGSSMYIATHRVCTAYSSHTVRSNGDFLPCREMITCRNARRAGNVGALAKKQLWCRSWLALRKGERSYMYHLSTWGEDLTVIEEVDRIRPLQWKLRYAWRTACISWIL